MGRTLTDAGTILPASQPIMANTVFFGVPTQPHLRNAVPTHIEEANALSSGEELLPNLYLTFVKV